MMRNENSIKQNADSALTIYTYESLLADPGYAYDRAFEQYAGLPNGSVNVVLLDDAGSILTKAVSEKADPVADVLIGIDNALVSQARQQDILTPYQPKEADKLVSGLVDGLASDYLLTPYDYGAIALWYLKQAFNSSIDTSSLKLNDLLQNEVRNQLIVENPNLSSPGLGFLLSTIAMFGDNAGVDSMIQGGWRDFWRQLSDGTKLSPSWGDAISLLYTKEAKRSMMVSYSTSPAYGACLYNDTSTAAVLPTINGTQYGWQQIEGLGVVKNAPHEALAKEFIDWFISEELQSQIHLNQWMYPARAGITAPDCYDAAIDPSTITPLNDRIPQNLLANNLTSWLDDWEVAWTEGTSGSFGLPFDTVGIFATLILIPVLLRRKKEI